MTSKKKPGLSATNIRRSMSFEARARLGLFSTCLRVFGNDRTPLAKCSGQESGKARDAGRGERTLGQPSCEAIKVEGRGGRHVLQAGLGQPTVARLAQAERAHALRERTLDPLTLGIKLTAGFTLQAGPSGRERLVFGARA